MKFTLLNLKNLLLFSGIIIGFTNPINATDYNSNDTNSTKYDDSWSSAKTNKYKSKFGFENKDEDKPCYGPNCKNKKKYFQDDYDVKRNKYESDFDLKNKRDEKPCIGKDCNNSLNESDKYDYSDYKYGNFDYLDEFEKDFDAISSNDDKLVPCTGSECYNECTGPDCDKSNKPVFMSSVYSSSYSSVTDSNGTRVAQKQYGMFDNGSTKYEEKELSNGNSKSGVVKTKYNNNTFDRKSNRRFSGNDKFFEEKFNDFVDGKPDARHMSYDKFARNARSVMNNNRLPSENSNRKLLNNEKNIYRTSYNMGSTSTNSSIEEYVE